MKFRIPEDIREALESYVLGQHPYPFGSFVTAVLANDLVGALGKADDNNRAIIFDYATYLHNEMPGRSGNPEHDYWGSYGAVANRIAEQRAARDLAKSPISEVTA